MTARPGRWIAAALGVAAIGGLLSLGIWQVKRLAWKEALIAQVATRLAAPPIPAPGAGRWAAIGPNDVYTRVSITGRLLNDRETLVQASTDLGPGYWVMTPLVTDRGFTLLINRGFVPPAQRDPATRTGTPGDGPGANPVVTITGLLRLSEPHGAFLHANRPDTGWWYSRDVAAIAARRGVSGPVAPYFVDADARSGPGWPRGGLTVIHFPNNHLQYALTWFAMAALLAATMVTLALRRREA